MDSSTSIEFVWNQELSKSQIASLLETCQIELDTFRGSLQIQVDPGCRSGGVSTKLPVQLWAERLAPEKFQMFQEKNRYFQVGCALQYSPLTAIPVAVSISRSHQFFSFSFEFSTTSILYECLPIDENGELCTRQACHFDSDNLDFDFHHFYWPAWSMNGTLLKQVALRIKSEFAPDIAQISPKIMNPQIHSVLDRSELLTTMALKSS